MTSNVNGIINLIINLLSTSFLFCLSVKCLQYTKEIKTKKLLFVFCVGALIGFFISLIGLLF